MAYRVAVRSDWGRPLGSRVMGAVQREPGQADIARNQVVGAERGTCRRILQPRQREAQAETARRGHRRLRRGRAAEPGPHGLGAAAIPGTVSPLLAQPRNEASAFSMSSGSTSSIASPWQSSTSQSSRPSSHPLGSPSANALPAPEQQARLEAGLQGILERFGRRPLQGAARCRQGRSRMDSHARHCAGGWAGCREAARPAGSPMSPGSQVTGRPHTWHVSPSGASGGWSTAPGPGNLSASQQKT